MLRKLVYTVLALPLLVATLGLAWFFANVESRPLERPPASSTLYDRALNEESAAAQDWLLDNYQRAELPSLSAAVGLNGRLVWAGTVGYADLEAAIGADQDSLYRFGSVAKSMTAAVVMRLVEQGRIDIEREFAHYVTDYSTSNAGFTLRHLLSHQAGIRHYEDQFRENLSNREYASTRDAAAIVENDPLLFSPGSNYHYTTYGYTLLSLAMERATAISFGDLMQEQLFVPLRMDATVLEATGNGSKAEVAAPYLYLAEYLLPAPQVNLSYKYAGGGVLSTPSDVVRFGNGLLGTELLGEPSLRELWTIDPLANGDPSPGSYGLGFGIGEDDRGRVVEHGGMSVGGSAYLLIYPEERVVVALAANTALPGNVFDRSGAARQLARIFHQTALDSR